MVMYIVGIIMCLCMGSSVSIIVYYYMVLAVNDYSSPEMVMITDVSFVVVGLLCPFLNFLLIKNNPAILHEPNIPGNVYLSI